MGTVLRSRGTVLLLRKQGDGSLASCEAGASRGRTKQGDGSLASCEAGGMARDSPADHSAQNRVGGNFFPLSHHLTCRSAPGGSIQIVVHTTNEPSLCEDFF